MIRTCVRVSSRLAISAAISWTLIPIASADAPSPQNEAASNPSVAAEQNSETPAKILHTVPEDGMGDTKWLSGATRFVRETVSKRPKDDLVICVAGCVPKQDRVVYAQPSEYIPPKPTDLMSDAKPAAPEKVPAAAAPAKTESKSAKAPEAEIIAPATNPTGAPAAAKAAVSAPAKMEKADPKGEAKNAAATPAAMPSTEGAAKPVTAPASATPAAAPVVTPVATPEAKPAVPAAKSVAIPAPTAPAAAPAQAPATAPAPLATEGKPALAPAANAARPDEMKKLEFVPSMSAPKPPMPAASADEDTTVPPEDRPKSRSRKGADAAPVPADMPR